MAPTEASRRPNSTARPGAKGARAHACKPSAGRRACSARSSPASQRSSRPAQCNAMQQANLLAGRAEQRKGAALLAAKCTRRRRRRRPKRRVKSNNNTRRPGCVLPATRGQQVGVAGRAFSCTRSLARLRARGDTCPALRLLDLQLARRRVGQSGREQSANRLQPLVGRRASGRIGRHFRESLQRREGETIAVRAKSLSRRRGISMRVDRNILRPFQVALARSACAKATNANWPLTRAANEHAGETCLQRLQFKARPACVASQTTCSR